MNMCQGCGGVIGRDCFNPQECMSITRQQAGLYEEQSQQAGELQAKVKRLEEEIEKHRWIPVSERLPKIKREDCHALLADEAGCFSDYVLVVTINNVWLTAYYDGKKNRWSFFGIRFPKRQGLKLKVTHWKPIILPEQALKANKDGKEER